MINMKYYKYMFLVVATMLFAGCVTYPVDSSYTPKADEGLFVIGVKNSGMTYSLEYNSYNNQTNEISKKVSAKRILAQGGARDVGRSYFVGAYKEGSYYFSSLITHPKVKTTYIYILPINNAVTFNLEVGKITYLGEYAINRNGEIQQLEFDKQGALEHIKSYPNIAVPFNDNTPIRKALIKSDK